jgi:hypothetical protein
VRFGSTNIMLVSTGYKTWRQTLDVRAGVTNDLDVALEKAPTTTKDLPF